MAGRLKEWAVAGIAFLVVIAIAYVLVSCMFDILQITAFKSKAPKQIPVLNLLVSGYIAIRVFL